MNERKQILEHLISLREPIESILVRLAAHPWDSETELAFLSFEHLSNVLGRYIQGSLSASDVEQWANAVEGRDDIGFEGNHDLQREILHELANPQLTEVLTIQRARQILALLSTSG